MSGYLGDSYVPNIVMMFQTIFIVFKMFEKHRKDLSEVPTKNVKNLKHEL